MLEILGILDVSEQRYRVPPGSRLP